MSGFNRRYSNPSISIQGLKTLRHHWEGWQSERRQDLRECPRNTVELSCGFCHLCHRQECGVWKPLAPSAGSRAPPLGSAPCAPPRLHGGPVPAPDTHKAGAWAWISAPATPEDRRSVPRAGQGNRGGRKAGAWPRAAFPASSTPACGTPACRGRSGAHLELPGAWSCLSPSAGSVTDCRMLCFNWQFYGFISLEELHQGQK